MRGSAMGPSAQKTADIQAFAGLAAPEAPDQLLESANLLMRWRIAVRQALATHHLVDVASALVRRFDSQPSSLETVGMYAPVSTLVTWLSFCEPSSYANTLAMPVLSDTK